MNTKDELLKQVPGLLNKGVAVMNKLQDRLTELETKLKNESDRLDWVINNHTFDWDTGSLEQVRKRIDGFRRKDGGS